MKKTQEKKLLKIYTDGSLQIQHDSVEENLLYLLLNNSVNIEHSCGGGASCGTCKIEVENADLISEPNSAEAELIQERQFRKNERLACQTTPILGLKFKISNNTEEL